MKSVSNGLIAGLAGTIVLSILMILKGAAGMLPELNVIAAWSALFGDPGNAVIGWIAHLVMGIVVWGVIFAYLAPYLGGLAYWVRGLVLGVIGWLAMMIIFMPAVGAGFFAAQLGWGAVIATLVLHLIYGAVLGWTFGTLVDRGRVMTRA